VISKQRGVRQTAYQIVVDGVWDSGKVASDQSVAVEYASPELKSQTRYDWRVRIWDEKGLAGEWSPRGRFVTGVRGKPWQGKWIAGEYGATTAKGIGSTPRSLPVFKRDLNYWVVEGNVGAVEKFTRNGGASIRARRIGSAPVGNK
jgi:alpha-L-rhamnosidase